MKILVSNVGSTSLKFKLYEMPEEKVLCTGKVERVGSDDAIFSFRNTRSGYCEDLSGVHVPSYTEGIRMFTECLLDPEHGVIRDIEEVKAVGFKTVAAKDYNGVHEITDDVIRAMRDYMPVAPAHNAAYIEAVGCFRKMLPDTSFIGVFETAFHQTIPKMRKIYSLPYEWYEQYGIQKLGYHGASHSYSAAVLEDLFGTTGKAVTCHLGGSGSLCAVEDGKSVDTSFGMSLQIGLPQNNRVGDLDPYVIRYLESKGMHEDDIFETMTKKSGLLGVSGVGRDLRYLIDAAAVGNERAQLAIDMFTDSILHYIGAYAAEMGGIENLVFTGGIGENSAAVRAAVCEKLAFLGLIFDAEANVSVGAGREGNAALTNTETFLTPEASQRAAALGVKILSKPESKVRVLVIPADEEIIVCRRTYEFLCE